MATLIDPSVLIAAERGIAPRILGKPVSMLEMARIPTA